VRWYLSFLDFCGPWIFHQFLDFLSPFHEMRNQPWKYPRSNRLIRNFRNTILVRLSLHQHPDLQKQHTKSALSTVVKQMLYSWMILGYKLLKSMTRMNLSYNPLSGSRTKPPLYLSFFFPPVTTTSPFSSSSWFSWAAASFAFPYNLSGQI
jgi:hypothetical protein